MAEQNKNNLSEDIKKIVQSALNNGDYKDLNKDIENVVKGALSEAKKSFSMTDQYIERLKVEKVERSRSQVPANISSKYMVPVGKTSNVLLTTFGGLGAFTFGIASFMMLLLGNTLGGRIFFNTLSLGFLPFLGASFFALYKGNDVRKRLKRFERYKRIIGEREYLPITQLALNSGQNVKYTVKDLQKMIDLGMYPEGHLSIPGDFFLLTNKAHGEYLKYREGLRLRGQEEREVLSEEKKIALDNLSKDARGMIEEGRKFVGQIRSANLAIPSEDLSAKLDKLEEVTDKIFDYVEVHPEKLPEIRKFMEYFLPTTLKLLEAYQRLDKQPIEGKNIISSKKEIEASMDTINEAFENLLDDLFEEMVMDISTDISVLETMFAQEGLLGNDIRNDIKSKED